MTRAAGNLRRPMLGIESATLLFTVGEGMEIGRHGRQGREIGRDMEDSVLITCQKSPSSREILKAECT